jgi:Bul1 C terminus/Bul1 N terminus
MDFARRQLAALSKPEVEITLDAEPKSPTFSTLDTITGHVSITVKHATPFSALDISLQGLTKTFISDPSRGSSIRGAETEAIHRFLRLVQPIDMSLLPSDRVMQPGTTYQVPFMFVVPAQLVLRACSHGITSDAVREAHLQLPPSLGDKSGEGKLDDMAPKDVKISYSIKARVLRGKEGEKATALAEASQKIRIRPANEEQPPMEVDEKDEAYILRKTKNLRKGLLKGKLGTLVMEAPQPCSFRLPALNTSEEHNNCSTLLRLRLRFDPASPTSVPPSLSTLSSKLRVSTHFATTARNHHVHPKNHTWMDMTADSVTEHLPLSNLAIGSVEWIAHKASNRRMSVASVETADSSDEEVAASDSFKDGSCYYTASVFMPLTLPSNKNLVPSFHSCLVSRVYAIHVALGLEKGATRSIVLKVPVQVSAAPSNASQEQQRMNELAEQAVRDAEAVFEPRILGPNPEFLPQVRRSSTMPSVMEMPPGYEYQNSYVSVGAVTGLH